MAPCAFVRLEDTGLGKQGRALGAWAPTVFCNLICKKARFLDPCLAVSVMYDTSCQTEAGQVPC